MNSIFRKNYYRFFMCNCIALLMMLSFNASSQTLKGKVYSFKNLNLNNITVKAKKSGNTVTTQADGSFSIQCHPKDKIVFSGQGFDNTTVDMQSDSVFVKMIFRGSEKSRKLAINNNHVARHALDFSVENFSAYNSYPCPHRMYNCFPCPHTMPDSYANKNTDQHTQLSMNNK